MDGLTNKGSMEAHGSKVRALVPLKQDASAHGDTVANRRISRLPATSLKRATLGMYVAAGAATGLALLDIWLSKRGKTLPRVMKEKPNYLQAEERPDLLWYIERSILFTGHAEISELREIILHRRIER